MLNRGLVLAPLDERRLNEARAAIMTPGRPAQLNQNFHGAVEAIIERTLDETMRKRATPYIDSCLQMLEEEFADLDPAEPIDPRFIRSFLIRR
jgi:Family of unknown function (DUF6178)